MSTSRLTRRHAAPSASRVPRGTAALSSRDQLLDRVEQLDAQASVVEVRSPTCSACAITSSRIVRVAAHVDAGPGSCRWRSSARAGRGSRAGAPWTCSSARPRSRPGGGPGRRRRDPVGASSRRAPGEAAELASPGLVGEQLAGPEHLAAARGQPGRDPGAAVRWAHQVGAGAGAGGTSTPATRTPSLVAKNSEPSPRGRRHPAIQPLARQPRRMRPSRSPDAQPIAAAPRIDRSRLPPCTATEALQARRPRTHPGLIATTSTTALSRRL